MNRNITRRICASTVAVGFLFAVTASQAQPTTYTWVSEDGYPGGISGTIVLSSPSYSGAYDSSRILSITLSDYSGTYHSVLPTDIYGWGSLMNWDPTRINELVLSLDSPGPGVWYIWADENLPISSTTAIRHYGGTQDVAHDYAGSWMVPEPGSMSLFALALTLASLRRMRERTT